MRVDVRDCARREAFPHAEAAPLRECSSLRSGWSQASYWREGERHPSSRYLRAKTDVLVFLSTKETDIL